MRFFVTGEWSRNRLLQTIVVLYAVYVAGLWLTNSLLYFSKMGLTYVSVVEYYLGSEARFLPARSYQGLLEVSHFHLFAMGMLLLVLTHLMLFVPISTRAKVTPLAGMKRCATARTEKSFSFGNTSSRIFFPPRSIP